MKFPKIGKLPSRPSKLIRVALDDLQKIARSKKYIIDMSSWHSPQESFDPGIPTKCEVCMAGAVMVRELDADITQLLVPEDFKEYDALEAINYFRAGRVGSAFAQLGLNPEVGSGFNRAMACFHDDRKAFYKDMNNLAKDLEEAGY